MINNEDIRVARKALDKVVDGEEYYSYLLEEFISKVERELNPDLKVPALLRRIKSESA